MDVNIVLTISIYLINLLFPFRFVYNISMTAPKTLLICPNCSKEFYKLDRYIRFGKKKNYTFYCSRHCTTTHAHKTGKIPKLIPKMITGSCINCDKAVTKRLRNVTSAKKQGGTGNFYCNNQCKKEYYRKLCDISVTCDGCGIEFVKHRADLAANKRRGQRNCCSKQCRNKFFLTGRKKQGNQRSKLEIWLEKQLNFFYPNLIIVFNDKITINSELDFYIPSLNLAFELNGIFHYEPIFGKEKLERTQNNDKRKFQACLEKGIELVIIDSSKESYFKENRAKSYLKIMTDIIDQKIKDNNYQPV
jgi:hypothetical protein